MPTRTRYAIANVTATLINSTASPTMMPNVIPTTFSASGRTTAKTNTPRRIIPMILKTFLASFIVCSPIAFTGPLNTGDYRPPPTIRRFSQDRSNEDSEYFPRKIGYRAGRLFTLFGGNYTFPPVPLPRVSQRPFRVDPSADMRNCSLASRVGHARSRRSEIFNEA